MPKEITDDLLYSSVRELGAMLRTRQISPVALTQRYLDRLEKVGPKLGAVVTVMREQALEDARRAESEIRAGRCTAFLTARKTCLRPPASRPPGARSRLRIRFSTTMRRLSDGCARPARC